MALTYRVFLFPHIEEGAHSICLPAEPFYGYGASVLDYARAISNKYFSLADQNISAARNQNSLFGSKNCLTCPITLRYLSITSSNTF